MASGLDSIQESVIFDSPGSAGFRENVGSTINADCISCVSLQQMHNALMHDHEVLQGRYRTLRSAHDVMTQFLERVCADNEKLKKAIDALRAEEDRATNSKPGPFGRKTHGDTDLEGAETKLFARRLEGDAIACVASESLSKSAFDLPSASPKSSDSNRAVRRRDGASIDTLVYMPSFDASRAEEGLATNSKPNPGGNELSPSPPMCRISSRPTVSRASTPVCDPKLRRPEGDPLARVANGSMSNPALHWSSVSSRVFNSESPGPRSLGGSLTTQSATTPSTQILTTQSLTTQSLGGSLTTQSLSFVANLSTARSGKPDCQQCHIEDGILKSITEVERPTANRSVSPPAPSLKVASSIVAPPPRCQGGVSPPTPQTYRLSPRLLASRPTGSPRASVAASLRGPIGDSSNPQNTKPREGVGTGCRVEQGRSEHIIGAYVVPSESSKLSSVSSFGADVNRRNLLPMWFPKGT